MIYFELFYAIYFKGQSYTRSYTLTNTCPIDSALFALYFIYRTDTNIASVLDSTPLTSPYSTLVKVFRIVETDGSDAARQSWLYAHGILEKFAQNENLFGSVDKQVFQLLKSERHYSYEIECLRAECKKKKRNHTSTELALL